MSHLFMDHEILLFIGRSGISSTPDFQKKLQSLARSALDCIYCFY
jgi:hypothetical protein